MTCWATSTLRLELRTRSLDHRLDDPQGATEPFYRELPVETVRLPCPRDLDPLLLRRVRHELRRLRPDVVHTHLVHGDLYGTLAAGDIPLVTAPLASRADPAQHDCAALCDLLAGLVSGEATGAATDKASGEATA